jgi:FkbM family methyltransferase
MTFHSQHAQDKYLYDNFFKDKKEKGVFVDIGAHDGVDISNTYFYEKELGWTGICIEPIKSRFDALRKNRSCICIEGCISDVEGEEEFVTFPEYTDMLSGIKKTFDTNTETIVNQRIAENNHHSTIIKVKSYNINNILKEHNIKDVDFVSLDTEGSELIILNTLNFDEFNIEFFVIENNKYNNIIHKFMKTKNYKLIDKLGCDEVYQKNKI